MGTLAPAPQTGAYPTVPSWDQLTEEYGGGIVARWVRNFPPNDHADVWIQARDRIVDGHLTVDDAPAPSSTRDGSMGDETYPSEPGHGTLSHSSSATSAVQW